jgi:catechol 2,3-dioxygenase-like lactoylglutathione lyase family enzyme
VTEPVQSLSAVTLAVPDMAEAVRFYEAAGFVRLYGGPDEPFTSYRAGEGFLNLSAETTGRAAPWGRAVFWVDDVDAMFERIKAAGYHPASPPADAPWGERYFHVADPAGHEISFARPLAR